VPGASPQRPTQPPTRPAQPSSRPGARFFAAVCEIAPRKAGRVFDGPIGRAKEQRVESREMNMPMRGNGTLGRGFGDSEDASGVSFAISQRDLGGGTSLVTVEGELDLASAPNLKWTLNDASKAGAIRIVLDLAPVTFIDSTALGVLVEARSRMTDKQAFVLAAPGAEARRALEVSGLDRHFNLSATVEEALAS
jgi:anti-sigma B factor antagonist